jgi:ferrochelatase
MTSRTGVLVMAHGTPGSQAEIASFYTSIRRGRPPSAEQLADLERRYQAIGGLSPLTQRTHAQVAALRVLLEHRHPGRYDVAYGSKHAHPLVEEGAAELVGRGADPIIGLVLTPHGSSRGSEEYLERASQAIAGRAFIAVPPWFATPAFIDALAARVKSKLGADGSPGPRPMVIFTAHSIPESAEGSHTGGDSYAQQLERSARLVAEAAGVSDWLVAWQSAGRTPEPWLGPDVREVIRQLGEKGETDAVVVCPIGFVADHLEVLYDLDVEAAAVAKECGLRFIRTDSLNDDPGLISALADAVELAATAHDTP